jgi:putative ABC transport system substrate-binding protein
MSSRREFITLLGGSAAWPLVARAQPSQRVPRIVVFTPLNADDPEAQARNAAFLQGLAVWGWDAGRNVRIDFRFGGGDPERYRKYAAEIVSNAPDVVLAAGSPTVAALQQANARMPVVFVNLVDPVGGGFVESLARPGGNMTGFTILDYGTSAKWLELLKEIAPRVTHVAVLRDPSTASGSGQLGAILSVAPSFGVELRPVGVRNAGEIERAVAAFAHESNGGLIVPASGLAIVHRELILTLAAHHRLPAVYPYRLYASEGGLMSYGSNSTDPDRRAAAYVDRILKGEKPADLPVQNPTKYELVINLKTAKSLGLTVPDQLLTRADEVIE